MNASGNLYTLFLTGYVLCFVFLNVITFLISSFYSNKFNQQSMRFGFLVAIVLFLLFIPSLYITIGKQGYIVIVQISILAIGSAASIWNCVVLFLTMKKVRK